MPMMTEERIAENYDACNHRVGMNCRCKPKCRICGWGRHMAIHCGTNKNPTKPYGHKFEPETDKRARL